ncbi:MAG: AraC family transcriptional regulator [Bacteroidales bacterium]|jgi:AraC-like DNA-binding protein|nr:AraC family transcriptional regulator [Bacteroidales bacterium]
MPRQHNKSHKGDPSEVQQSFPSYDLQLLCCRFWTLKRWEFDNLSFPYWRVYHNFQEGAHIRWDNGQIELTPNEIYLIAPNTPYSTHLKGHKVPEEGYRFEGDRITKHNISAQHIQHLFIHFNLGMPYDNITPGIISVPLTSSMKCKTETITHQLLNDAVNFSFLSKLTVRALINELLCAIPQEKWQEISQNNRVVRSLNYIENNIGNNLSNSELAMQAGLATNSFTRLFTAEINTSPQRYVKQKRIDKACILLHHSNHSIDRIAEICGFADRYHFSRIFKEATNNTPATYRKLR